MTEVKDDLIAREIQRIESLTKKELISELIDLKSKEVEQMSNDELLVKSRNMKNQKIEEEFFCRKCGKTISRGEVELNDDEMCSICYAERHQKNHGNKNKTKK